MNSTEGDSIFDSPLTNRLMREWKEAEEDFSMDNYSTEKFQELLATLKSEEWRWNESLITVCRFKRIY